MRRRSWIVALAAVSIFAANIPWPRDRGSGHVGSAKQHAPAQLRLTHVDLEIGSTFQRHNRVVTRIDLTVRQADHSPHIVPSESRSQP